MIKLIATAYDNLPVAEDTIREVLDTRGELAIVPLPFHSLKNKQKPKWLNLIKKADALLVRSGIVDKWLIDEMDNCKVIALHGVGVDQVDIDYCKSKNITVTNVPGANTNAAAELTIGLMIDSLRRISKADMMMKNRLWQEAKYIGNELGHKKVGVLGMGNIGKKVAKLAEAFGSEVAYYDKLQMNKGFRFLKFNNLIEWCDILSVHIPLNSETFNLISLKELNLLGPEGILINIARGPIVNLEDLTYALKNKLIKWAACDVFHNEPPKFEKEFFKQKNITITPHIAGSTYESLKTIAKIATTDIIKVLDGNKVTNIVV